MRALGLTPVPATQVIARDRHAEFLYACASVGATRRARSPSRSATCSAPRCARCEEAFRAGPEGLARRCPTSATRSRRAASAAWPGCCAATSGRARGRRAVARARHLALVGRAGRSCPTRSHARLLRAARGCRGVVEGLQRRTPSACCENLDASLRPGVQPAGAARARRGGLTRDDAYRIVQRNAMRTWEERRPFRRRARATTPRSPRARRRALDERLRPRARALAQRRPHVRRARRARDGAVDVSRRRCRTCYSGQGPRHLRRRRRPHADGRVRPHLGVRRRDGRADPRQGPGAHRACRRSGSSSSRDVAPQPPGLDRPRRLARRRAGARASRAGRCCAAGPRCSRSSASCAATSSGSAWKEYQATGTMHGAPLPAGLQESEQLPEPVFTPSTKAEIGPRREHHRSTTAVDARRRRRGRAGPRHLRSRVYARGRRAGRPSAGIIIADTKFELGFVDGELRRVRRGAHARLVALLAGRRVGAGHHAAVVRQAARPRLPRRPRTGTRRRRRRRCPPRSSTPPARATSRPTSASPAVASPTGTACADVSERDASRCSSRCSLRPGIADPQGATIERSLPALGFDGVARRAGRQVASASTIEAADEAAARAAGRRAVPAVPHQPGDRGRRRSRVDGGGAA